MTPYEQGYMRMLKMAGIGDDFIQWARRTTPIMTPLQNARKSVLHGLGDAGHEEAALALNKVIGGESPLGRLLAADRAVSQRLGLLAPPDVKVKETHLTLTPELLEELGVK